MSCNICCEDYKKTPISCGFCSFDACQSCCENFILCESKPKCMNLLCGKDWDRKFIKAQLGSLFINTKFKSHMENLLYEQEKALMPITQPIVEKNIKEKKIKKQLNEVREQINNLKKIKELAEHNLERLKQGLEPIDNLSLAQNIKYNIDDKNIETPVKKTYVRTCPADGCRGFLNSDWFCGICDTSVCNKCHEILSSNSSSSSKEHICDKDNIASAQLIDKETKQCPKCATKIFKRSGCDQMWCTQCHTAFSWKTGKIETHIHNPHYYEWKRNNGGLDPEPQTNINVGEGCFNIIDHNTFVHFRNLTKSKSHTNLCWTVDNPRCSNKVTTITDYDPNITNIGRIIENCSHNHHAVMPTFTSDIIRNNEKYRIQFMSNEITEEKFKALIQRNDKKVKKDREILDVLQFSENALSDIINRIIDDLNKSEPNKHKFQELYKEVNSLREYCNNIFADISDTYDCILYNFDLNFRFITIKSESEIKRNIDKFETRARDWLIEQTKSTDWPQVDYDKPTALREAATNYMTVEYFKQSEDRKYIEPARWMKWCGNGIGWGW